MTKQADQDENRKAGFAYAAGIALFASVVTFCAAGWLIDNWFGIAPWGLISGIILGSAAGLFEFIRLSSKTY
ncbi:MAG TPA: AtpZ/AtpI family protein [Pyrinomonadaceae bacterium]|nr:AtpZ/AtpI family protein [Pyrinomonadaceae bacterium]